jgi:hypothetical protein
MKSSKFTLVVNLQPSTLRISTLSVFGLSNPILTSVYHSSLPTLDAHRYRKEGIEWVPIEYFNNEILCQLIESTKKPIGQSPISLDFVPLPFLFNLVPLLLLLLLHARRYCLTLSGAI